VFGVQLTVGNAVEFLVPWFMKKLKIEAEEKLADDDDLPPMTEAEYESKLEQYDHLEGFEDYNEMVIQFGFIALFAPAFPLVSLMGLVNNVIEIRSDSNKLCRVFQRPIARVVEDIGTWEMILDLMTYIAVATNVGLLWFTSEFGSQYTPLTRVWGFLVSEHAFMIVKCAIAYAIPDIPEDVKDRIAAEEVLTKKALGQDEITSKGQGKWYIQEADLAKARYDDKFIDMYSKGDGADPEIEPAEEDPKSDEDPSESHTTSFLDAATPRTQVGSTEAGVPMSPAE